MAEDRPSKPGARGATELEAALLRHLSDLQGYLRLRMGPQLRGHFASMDLVQSVAREVIEDGGDFEFRGDAEFRKWLFTRARHKVLQKARYVGAERRDPARERRNGDGAGELLEAYGSLATPSADLESREAIAAIEAAFDALPEDTKEAVTLHKLVGLDYPEIADRMQRSVGATRTLVYRGLARLALELGRARRSREGG